MPTPSFKNGFGVQSQLVQVSQLAAGVNSVLKNVGAGVAIVAVGAVLRLTTLRFRVDLAPDVAGGSVSVPVLWRVVVFSAGQIPQDISALQAQAYAAGAHPEIPAVQGQSAPGLSILHDEWLDFSQGDEGLNKIAVREWTQGGPSAEGGNFLCVLVAPLLDANMDQEALGNANANIYVEAFGETVVSEASAENASSLPRYDVSVR